MSSAFRPYRRTPSISNASEISDISSKANGCDADAFVDVYRESQMNGFRRVCRRRGNGQFVQEDEEENIGVVDKHQAVCKPTIATIPILEKTQLDHRGIDLCRELHKVLQLTEEFRQDVATEKMSSADLLIELASKIRPFLVRFDEEMAVQEETVKKNIDRCLITDQKVDWLLRHNRFMLEFRRLVERLTVRVYDELERILRLKVRGVHGAELKQDVGENLVEIGKKLEEVEAEVVKEKASTRSLVESLK